MTQAALFTAHFSFPACRLIRIQRPKVLVVPSLAPPRTRGPGQRTNEDDGGGEEEEEEAEEEEGEGVSERASDRVNERGSERPSERATTTEASSFFCAPTTVVERATLSQSRYSARSDLVVWI